MSNLSKRIGAAGAIAALSLGSLLMSGGVASAAPSVNCGANQPTVTVGGLEGCTEPPNPKELDCYKGAAPGAIGGAIAGAPGGAQGAAAGAAGGAVSGCINGVANP